jgi:hypothetical protein
MSPVKILVTVASMVLAPILSVFSLACDLAAPHGNPKDVAGIVIPELAAAANAVIATDRDRFYDLVSPTDGMTLGFGNWPQQEMGAFFADMKRTNGGTAITSLAGCLSEFFSKPANEGSWAAFEYQAQMGSVDSTPEGIRNALEKTLLDAQWMKRYATHCKVNCLPGEPNLYREQQKWFVPAMQFALRDRDVIAWQMDYWDRTIVAKAANFAANARMSDDEAAIVAFTAYASSSPGWATPVIQASGSGTLKFGHYTWFWNTPPMGAAKDGEGLRRWHLAIIWQYYVHNTRREQLKRIRTPPWEFRGRSRAFYNVYLKDRWRLPDTDSKGEPIWTSDKNLDPALIRPRDGA